MKKLFLPFCVLLLTLVSCEKDNDSQPSRSENLTSGGWKFEKATAGGFDVSSQVPSCYKDNVITFQTGGTGTVTEGADVCVPPADPTFTWSLQNNDTELNLSLVLLPGSSNIFKIVTLNQTNLVLSQDMNLQPFGMTTVVVTLKH